MDFGFTEEQELLRNEVRRILDEHCSVAEVRRIAEADGRLPEPLWKQIAELGWLGVTLPESLGGAGLGWVDLVVVLEETGRSLFPGPLISTTLAQAAVQEAGSRAQQERWLPGLIQGSRVGSLALLEACGRLGPEGVALTGERRNGGWQLSGEKLLVHDAGVADLFVLAFRPETGRADSGVELAVVERGSPGLEVEELPGIDLTRRLGRLRLSQLQIPEDAVLRAAPGEAVLARLLDLGACAVAAEIVGAAEAALDLTVRYAQQRVQFGEPIGRFQGVKHPLAEMYVDVESFKSLVYYAAWALDQRHPDASLAVSRAKAYASDAFARIGIEAVQLHGGIGYTWEYDAQLYLKRSKWARPAFGDADYHYGRVAALGGA